MNVSGKGNAFYRDLPFFADFFSLRERKFSLIGLSVEGYDGIKGVSLLAFKTFDDSCLSVPEEIFQLGIG